jgi:hypothetical protein
MKSATAQPAHHRTGSPGSGSPLLPLHAASVWRAVPGLPGKRIELFGLIRVVAYSLNYTLLRYITPMISTFPSNIGLIEPARQCDRSFCAFPTCSETALLSFLKMIVLLAFKFENLGRLTLSVPYLRIYGRYPLQTGGCVYALASERFKWLNKVTCGESFDHPQRATPDMDPHPG